MRPNGSKRSGFTLFEKYNVDIVLQDHDHTYGRTGFTVPDTIAKVPTGVQALEERHGTIYVVSVSGPKMYNNNRLPFMKRLGEGTQLYQVIHIDGPRLRFEARTAIGELYDAFELKKQPGQANQLIELEPEVSENLRETANDKS